MARPDQAVTAETTVIDMIAHHGAGDRGRKREHRERLEAGIARQLQVEAADSARRPAQEPGQHDAARQAERRRRSFDLLREGFLA